MCVGSAIGGREEIKRKEAGPDWKMQGNAGKDRKAYAKRRRAFACLEGRGHCGHCDAPASGGPAKTPRLRNFSKMAGCLAARHGRQKDKV
jgi:hypothetical protein